MTKPEENKTKTSNLIIEKIKSIWVIIGITIFLIIIIEGIASLIANFVFVDPVTRKYNEQEEIFKNSDYYKNLKKEEMASLKVRWDPYDYWKRVPFKGKYVNISFEGIRKTWNPVIKNTKARPLTIFIFGGSTMWGTGSRDDYTIPSDVAKILSENTNIDFQVINLGEYGYVSAQELISLIRELQKGIVPDIVVFYDGINDTYTAYQNCTAGLSHNEFNRVKDFNLHQDKNRLAENYLNVAIKTSGIYRVMSTLKKTEQIKDPACENVDMLVDSTIYNYLTNIGLVEHIGKLYGFKTLFYWQPSIFCKKELSKYEQKQLAKEKYLQDFHDKVYNKIKSLAMLNSKANFTNLSDIFYNSKEELFIDYSHITENGNKAIAEKIAEDVLKIIKEKDNKGK
ncbi:MAG: SGNH/GDSL hydrolase family protein [Cyanobacteriota bacterium]